MVKETKKSGNILYRCEGCDFYYKDKSWAQKCENYCKKYKACSLEITKHSER